MLYELKLGNEQVLSEMHDKVVTAIEIFFLRVCVWKPEVEVRCLPQSLSILVFCLFLGFVCFVCLFIFWSPCILS